MILCRDMFLKILSSGYGHKRFGFFGCLVSSLLIAARGPSLVAASRGLLFIAVCGLLIAVASLVVEHRL